MKIDKLYEREIEDILSYEDFIEKLGSKADEDFLKRAS